MKPALLAVGLLMALTGCMLPESGCTGAVCAQYANALGGV
jgi:hypothetical protein